MLYYHTLDDHYLSGKNPKFIKMFFFQSKQMMHKKLTVFYAFNLCRQLR